MRQDIEDQLVDEEHIEKLFMGDHAFFRRMAPSADEWDRAFLNRERQEKKYTSAFLDYVEECLTQCRVPSPKRQWEFWTVNKLPIIDFDLELMETWRSADKIKREAGFGWALKHRHRRPHKLIINDDFIEYAVETLEAL